MERPYDSGGSFAGKPAIRSYWARQVGTQQRGVQFRQLSDELIWDEERQTALAKWEAAFERRCAARGQRWARPCTRPRLSGSALGIHGSPSQSTR